jgi:hypothetical protein
MRCGEYSSTEISVWGFHLPRLESKSFRKRIVTGDEKWFPQQIMYGIMDGILHHVLCYNRRNPLGLIGEIEAAGAEKFT